MSSRPKEKDATWSYTVGAAAVTTTKFLLQPALPDDENTLNMNAAFEIVVTMIIV